MDSPETLERLAQDTEGDQQCNLTAEIEVVHDKNK